MFLRGRAYMVMGFVTVVAAAVVIVATISWIGCELGIHPEREPEAYTFSQFNLPLPEEIHFKSRDGLRLTGSFFPGTNGATIILTHGRGGNRTWMLPHANYLHGDGFSILTFDFRHHGESEGDESTFGAKESWDIEGAILHLKKRPDVDSERIGVQGISLGASSAILAAAEVSEIKGVVAEIPFKSLSSVIDHSFGRLVGLPSFPFATGSKLICELRLDIDIEDVAPVKVISKISPRSVFLIDPLEDNLFPADSVEVLYEAAREPKLLWQIPGAPHGRSGGWETTPVEYERRVLAFWRQTFGI